MTTALLAWEIGAGAGHLLRLAAIARALRARGRHTVFVVRDLAAADELLGGDPSPRFQAPLWTRPLPPSERPFGASSYGDVLALLGFGDPESLAAVLGGWDALFRATGAALVVADNAPGACLAAAGALPVALVGDGFSLPPAHAPSFPPLHPHLPPIAAEARLLDAIAAVQRQRGRPSPATLPALLAAPFRGLCTVSPLDPYAAVRAEPALGPLAAPPAPAPIPFAPALLSAFQLDGADAEPLLDALLALDVPGASQVRGAAGSLGRLPVKAMLAGRGGALAHLLAARGCAVLRRADLDAVLPATAIVAHHGDPDVAEAALLAGRPQLVLPLTSEQRVVARLMDALRAGIVLTGERPASRLGERVHAMLTDQTWRDRAFVWGKRLAAENPTGALGAVASACEALV